MTGAYDAKLTIYSGLGTRSESEPKKQLAYLWRRDKISRHTKAGGGGMGKTTWEFPVEN